MKVIPGFAALLALAGCATARVGDEAGFGVLVYNIHAGRDAGGVDNLERVAAVIRDSKADVVLLQEVDRGTTRSGRVDQLARLTELTRFHGEFGKTLDYQGGEYGIAILSRWPIAADTLIPLAVDSTSGTLASHEPRGALVATVAAPFAMLRLINTHLDASRTDFFRMQEVRTVLAVAGERQALRIASLPEARMATIVGGDFNSEPESPVHAAMISAGWRDAFVQCGKGSGLSFPDKRPVKRIDYLFFGRETRCTEGSVLETSASDHRPLLFHVIVSRYRRF